VTQTETHNNIETSDLLVVGGGAGGLAAAVRFLEASPSSAVTVLESAPFERRGGNTWWTRAFFRLNPDGTPTDDFADRIIDYSLGQAPKDIVDTLVRDSADTIAWISEHGVKMTQAETYFLTSKGSRLMPDGGGRAIVETLTTRVEELGGRILYGETARRLIQDDDRVLGVESDNLSRRVIRRHASSVILATGGFQGNREMLRHHLGARAETLVPICDGGTFNRGAALEMAVSAGADVAGQFDMFHGETSDPRTAQAEALVMIYPYGVLVNGQGRRFLDEGRDTVDETFEDVAYHVWRDANQESYLIVDQKLLTSDYQKAILADTEPVVADSIGELADRLGIDALQLERTISGYNSACEPGPLDVTVRDGVSTTGLVPAKSNWARPVNEGPFGAWPISCVITFTFGGVRTDVHGRAVRHDGSPIDGLYVVGEASGLYYHSYPGASSVLRALVFGRAAASHAVSEHATVTA
jgi:tricarballylate dehydrogenase